MRRRLRSLATPTPPRHRSTLPRLHAICGIPTRQRGATSKGRSARVPDSGPSDRRASDALARVRVAPLVVGQSALATAPTAGKVSGVVPGPIAAAAFARGCLALGAFALGQAAWQGHPLG